MHSPLSPLTNVSFLSFFFFFSSIFSLCSHFGFLTLYWEASSKTKTKLLRKKQEHIDPVNGASIHALFIVPLHKVCLAFSFCYPGYYVKNLRMSQPLIHHFYSSSMRHPAPQLDFGGKMLLVKHLLHSSLTH